MKNCELNVASGGLLSSCASPTSGAEDRHGYIWDRHYNICLAKLQHEDVVNSVAFSPMDQEMLITASDDCTLKVWRSPRVLRIINTKPSRKKFSFFWLNKK